MPRRKFAPLCPAGHLPLKGGDRLGAGALPSRKTRPGFCPPVPLSFPFAQVETGRTGRLRLPRKLKNKMTPGGAPFGGFCPATSISLRRRSLPGIFQAGPVLIGTGGRPHTLDNPILPPCHATQALPARCQGRQGVRPSKAVTLAPTSPGGDHFPRTRSVGSCVSPPNPAPAPPRHNALWCIRGRNGFSLERVARGGEETSCWALILLGNFWRSSPVFGAATRV